MKLICIEDGPLPNKRGGFSKNCEPKVLEGHIYTGVNRFIHQNGNDVWFIKELGCTKRAQRFIPCSEKEEENIYNTESIRQLI